MSDRSVITNMHLPLIDLFQAISFPFNVQHVSLVLRHTLLIYIFYYLK